MIYCCDQNIPKQNTGDENQDKKKPSMNTTWFPVPKTPHTKWQLDQVSHFCRVQSCKQQTGQPMPDGLELSPLTLSRM